MVGKTPTIELRKEHEKVLSVLEKLEKSLGQKNAKAAGKEIAVLEKEFGRHSLNKEEKVLFPEFEKYVPRDNGPTGMMIIEHQELVESIKKFKQELENNNLEEAASIGNSIINLLRQHIDKENNILFNMIDMHLNEKQVKKVLEGFKRIDSGK